MARGQLNINDVTDEQFKKLIEIKDKTDGALTLDPNHSVTPVSINVGGKSVQGFTGIVMQIQSNNQKAFTAAAEILEMLAT